MPELEIVQDFDHGVDATFGLMFGAEVFARFHKSEKHPEYRIVSDWTEDGNGLLRNMFFTLPANALLRIPVVEVKAQEFAVKDASGSWVISGSSVNEGSELAKATQVTARYTLTPQGRGTRVLCFISYTFALSSIPWMLRRTIEAVMHSEVRNGHNRFLQAAKVAESDKVTSHTTPGVVRYLTAQSATPPEGMNKSFTSSLESGARGNESFYTPMTSPVAEPTGTPLLEDLPPIDTSPWRDETTPQPPPHRVIDFSQQPSPSNPSHPQLRVQPPPETRVPLTAQTLREVESEKPATARRYSTTRYRKLILLVLALSVSWCLGHLSAVAMQPIDPRAASRPPA
eukprot:TRINITY_DN76934_c0_g1_i1.p1 TRINITY_DN76934_c0_g1~~TRINITY_DN76934_c0_g1_i1.p1  ORF type:complete len:374 (+),score=99.82 TRINITY_DN76934_c0_g1_i1:99-1124(+)